MKKILLILLSIFSFFIASCTDSGTTSDDNTCTPECKAYEICNTDGACDLKAGMCADDNDCSGDKPVCDANECIVASDDCDPVCDASYQVCNAGNCDLKTGFCEDSNDCSGDTPICSGGHQCVADNNGATVTLKELKDSGIEGNKYTTHGIVTTKDNDGFFMQDDSDRGIYVYMNLANGEFMAQKIGDKVTVTGAYKIYYGFNELTYFIDEETPSNSIDLDITTDSSDNDLPEFKEISATDTNLENFESMLVKLANPDFSFKKKLADSGSRDYDVLDSLDKPFTVNDYILNLEYLDGVKLSKIQGVLKYHKDEFKLIPRKSTDVERMQWDCVPTCSSYQDCNLVNDVAKCELKDGACEDQVDCEVGQTCENHACITPEPINLVPNGDLEDWTTNSEATGWIYEYDNQAETTGTKESTIVFEGSFAAKVKKVDGAPKKGDFLSPAFEINTTKQYSITMNIYDNDVNVKARIYFVFYDDTNHSNGMTNFGDYTTTFDGWKEYKFNNDNIYSGISSEEIDTIKTMRVGVRLYDDEADGTGYIYLDDVRVIEKLNTK